MALKDIRGQLIELRNQVKFEQHQEVLRALEFRDAGDDRKAAYHLGLADGRNNMVDKLEAILRSQGVTHGRLKD